jgi:hypothetical protein
MRIVLSMRSFGPGSFSQVTACGTAPATADFAPGGKETDVAVGWKNQPVDPVPEPGDRQDCQRISGKRHRKSMAVLSVPGGHSR